MKSIIQKIKFTLLIILFFILILNLNRQVKAQPPNPFNYNASVYIVSPGPMGSEIIPGPAKIIYVVQITVNGSNIVTLNSATFKTDGNYQISDLDGSFNLYYNDNYSTEFTTFEEMGTEIGNQNIAASGSELVFSDLNQQISGSVYLILTANIASDAVNNHTIFCQGSSLEDFVFLEDVNYQGANPLLASKTQTIKNGLYANLSYLGPIQGNIYANTTNNIIYKIKVIGYEYKAQVNPIEIPVLSELKVNTDGIYSSSDLAPVTPFKLWYSTNSLLVNGFSTGATQLASHDAIDSGQEIIFENINQNIGSNCYLYITADISETATNNNTIKLKNTPFSAFSFSNSNYELAGISPIFAGATQTINSEEPPSSFIDDVVDISLLGPNAADIDANTSNNILHKLKISNPSLYTCFIKTVCRPAGALTAALTLNTTSCPTPVITFVGHNTICSDDSVKLTTNFSPNFIYQWTISTSSSGTYTPISGATSNEYYAKPGSTTKYYKVVVKSSCGIATSAVTTITVPTTALAAANAGHYIVNQPLITLGTTMYLSKAQAGIILKSGATGPTVQYQWQKASADIPGATNSIYELPTSGTAPSDGTFLSGLYRVKVTNGCGTTGSGYSTGYTITIYANSTTAAQATYYKEGDLRVGDGSTVKLKANDFPLYTYQWKNAGVNIVGATNATFEATEPGEYQCALNTGLYSGTATSSKQIILPFSSHTAVITTMGSAYLCPGGSVEMRTNNNPAYQYQWQIATNTTTTFFTNIVGATNYNYIATPPGTRYYRVIVKTSPTDSTISAPQAITVATAATNAGSVGFMIKDNPIIPMANSTGITVCTGQTGIKLVSGANGSSYQWQKGTSTTFGTNTIFATNSEPEIEIPNDANGTGSSGYYRVIVTGGCFGGTSTAASSYFRISVSATGAPALLNEGSLNIDGGSDLAMYAPNFPGFEYQWRRDGVDIPGETNSLLSISTHPNTITSINLPTAGTFINTEFNPGAVKLWYSSLSTLTNNHTNFSSLGYTVQLATADLPASGSDITFSGFNQKLGGTYYLYTTLDVSLDVTPSDINIGSTPLNNIVLSGAATRTGADPMAAAGLQTIRTGMNIDISRAAPTATTTVTPNQQNIVLYALKLIQSSALTEAYHLKYFSVTPNGNYLTGDLVPNSFKLWLHTNSTNATLASDGIPIDSKPITSPGVPVIWTDLNTEIPGSSTRYLIITVDISANPSNGRYIHIPNNPFSNIDFEEEHNKTGSDPTLAGAAVVFASLSSVNFQCPLSGINYKVTKNANSNNVIIYPFKLTNTIVPNTAVPVLDAINLITNGSYLSSDIKLNSVKLWKSTVSNLAHGFNPASADLLQTIDIVPVEGTLSFPNLNLTLNSGANYFYITIDIFSGCNNANFIYINSAVFDNFIFIDPISKTFTSPISYPFTQGHTITFASSVWKSSAGTTDWLNTANWTDATVPDNLVSTIIQPGVNQPIISSGTYNVYNLTCNLNSSLTIEPNNSTATLNISNNLIIKNGANFIINAGTGEDINVTVKNVIIEAGGTLTIAAGQNLTVTGNWSCDGTVTCGINYGTVVFQGTEEQSISGGTFNNFTIDNSSGVYLTGETGFNGVLKILAGDFDTSDQLKLVSNATQTGCISGSGAGTITGTVTVQRYNTGSEGYHYISAPTANTTFDQIIDDMAGNAVYPQEYETYTTGPISHLWEYDETNVSQTLHPTTGYSENDQLMMNGWRTPDPTSAMVPMKGYSANIPAGSGLEVTETVNNGPYSLAVTYTNSGNAEVDGWNLMGNPYPSPIDWDAAAGWTKTNVNDAIYFFVPTSKYLGQHHTYIGGVGNPGTVTGIIPMFQAFWVKTIDNGTLGVTNTVRVDNIDPTFYKKTNKSDDKQLIRLKGTFLSNINLKDETVVYFSDGPTRGFDGNYDAYKLMNNDGSPNIYTMAEGSKLSINGLPTLTEENESVPLEFDVTSKGEYRLEAIEIKDFVPVTEILLEDKFLGIMQDLKLNPSYVFNINTSDEKGRFLLHFKPEITDINTNKVSEYIRAYTFGKNLVIGFNSSDVKAKADINIYNIFGQKVISDKTIGIGTHNIQLDLATGFYYVRMTYNNRTVAQKVFIE